ncbi:MAG: cupin domain-containing protein [Gemmatimonadota bacterium]|nr:cupin domain-containing protein [Gemmatimonadota bacterium]
MSRILLATLGTLILFSTMFGQAPGKDPPEERSENTQRSKLWAPDEGERIWVFPDSKDEVGSGLDFHIYVDPETEPDARASFARFSLGVDGALPEHRHEKTEEFAYFVSGEGIVLFYENGEPRNVDVGPGYVWYNPAGVWHSIRNTGDEPLEVVFATVPNEKHGLMSFFRKIGVKPGEEPKPLPPDELRRIANDHDLILEPQRDAEK